jgi:hypothetical protein
VTIHHSHPLGLEAFEALRRAKLSPNAFDARIEDAGGGGPAHLVVYLPAPLAERVLEEGPWERMETNPEEPDDSCIVRRALFRATDRSYDAVLFEAEDGDPAKLLMGLTPPTRGCLSAEVRGGFFLSEPSLRVWWDGAVHEEGWARALQVAKEQGCPESMRIEHPTLTDVFAVATFLLQHGVIQRAARYHQGADGLHLVEDDASSRLRSQSLLART